MDVLLILNNKEIQNLRIMVRLTNKALIQQVIRLLQEDKDKEAFELLKRRAEVVYYLPQGKKPLRKPAATLIEDLL